MLRVSYCDSAMSVTCCVSCVISYLACVRSRGHIFSLIIMKLGQNVCHDEILYKFKNGSCGVKN